MQNNEPTILVTKDTVLPPKRHSHVVLGIALAVAAVSDVLSIWITFLPPAQWGLDCATALILFLILGRRWALLPGLIAEAIPGVGVFPVWVLVVASIAIYDGIRRPTRV